jgi:thermitase
MTEPDQRRFERWRDRRSGWIQQKCDWVREHPYSQTPVQPIPVMYVRDEILVRDDHHEAGLNVISGLGHPRRAIETRAAVPGYRLLKTTGLDAYTAAQRLRENLGPAADGPAGVGVNHVFMSSPFDHGGPYGAPAPFTGTVPLNGPAGSGVRVTVLDTGVWADSPLPRTSYQATEGDFETELDIDNDGHVDSDVGHANFIAGVVLSRTANARVHILKVLNPLGICTEVELANALLSLSDVDIVNLSLGGFTDGNLPPAALATALEALLSGHDRVVVAAAGNEGQVDQPFWPAAFSTAGRPWSDQVLAVAAHDGSEVCTWSNKGPWITLAAPGQNVTSTYVKRSPFDTGWAKWSGTSFATPYVVAAIADQVASAGSITAASQHVRKLASNETFDGVPVLP